LELSKVFSCALQGIEAKIVEVEVSLSRGLPSFIIVGLPEVAVKESRERVESAIKSMDFEFPLKKITVNLAPADIKKEGTSLDLPIALGILAASGQIDSGKLENALIVGELALDGRIRKVKGVLPASILAKEHKIERMVVPFLNAEEAGVVKGAAIYPVDNINECIDTLGDGRREPFLADLDEIFRATSTFDLDFSDVKGQDTAKRALEVAVAGGHNVLMIGPPGSGKTMLAKRIPTILPLMNIEEAIETTKIHSVVGALPPKVSLIAKRPFRFPHHTISYAGLIGGGTYPQPGEVSLAHNGVLFLDELPEFNRNVLEVLRQPLEDGFVTISRAKSTIAYPARFMLIGAMNPCPCGYFGDAYRECSCTPSKIDRYRSKISGPLLDRIDMHVTVGRVKYNEIMDMKEGESSRSIRKRIEKCRKIQEKRYKKENIYFNAHLDSKKIRKYCIIDEKSRTLLNSAMDKFGFSARAVDRILKMARTISDLEGERDIGSGHIAEAIQYRTLDRKLWLTK
jgi:magnesium chelatase family protein